MHCHPQYHLASFVATWKFSFKSIVLALRECYLQFPCKFDQILDTESIYTEITQRIADEYGKVYDWEMKSKVMGRSAKDAAIMTVKLLDLPITFEEYLEKATKLEQECFPHCKPMPGMYYKIEATA